jgi:hypothetical protein
VRLAIIATTFRSTIFETHVFSLYSHLGIYIVTDLETLYVDWLHAEPMSYSWCAWKWKSSELRDTLWGHVQAIVKMHMEVVIERIWRYTCRMWSSDHSDAYRDHDWAGLVTHLWRPWSCEGGGRNRVTLDRCPWRHWSGELAGYNRGSLAIHLEAGIERVWRCTWRPSIRKCILVAGSLQKCLRGCGG